MSSPSSASIATCVARCSALPAGDTEAWSARPDVIDAVELLEVLLRGGGEIVSRGEFGCLIKIERHLVFVATKRWLSTKEVHDVRAAAGMGPGRLDRLLMEVRHLSATSR